MEIGYGSISIFDSIRYKLYFDGTDKAFFLDVVGKKYLITLNIGTINNILNNKRIWITLTEKSPREISEENITNFPQPKVRLIDY